MTLGYTGVLVFNPAGKLIGRIRLPEARGMCEFVFRRAQVRPPVQSCEPVALYAPRRDARRCSRISCKP